MRNSHKDLIVALTHTDLLLPERIFPDDDGAHSLFHEEVDHALANSVQIMVHLPVALVGESLHLPGDMPSVPFGKALLEFFHAFVVPLVPGFERPTVNQARHEAYTV